MASTGFGEKRGHVRLFGVPDPLSDPDPARSLQTRLLPLYPPLHFSHRDNLLPLFSLSLPPLDCTLFVHIYPHLDQTQLGPWKLFPAVSMVTESQAAPPSRFPVLLLSHFFVNIKKRARNYFLLTRKQLTTRPNKTKKLIWFVV